MPDEASPDVSAARRAMRRTWGYDTFRPGQEEVLSAVLAGEDVPVGPDAIAGCVPLAVPEGREEPQP